MKKVAIFFLSLFLIALFWNCSGEKKSVEIESYDKHEDQVTDFSLIYPSNWFTQKFPGSRFLAFTDKAVKKRFVRYAPKGTVGAKIEILVTKLDSNVTFDSAMNNKIFQKEVYSEPKEITIDGVAALKQTYNFELEDGPFHGEVYYATKDSDMVTTIYFEAFSGMFKAYQDCFDTVLASIKLATKPKGPDTVYQKEEASPPSENLVRKSGKGWSMGIPENFEKERGMFVGKRRGDCFIRVDIYDAPKANDIEKLAKGNSNKVDGAGKLIGLTINGEESVMFPYKPSGKVTGEMYFFLKNDKLYRITLNWFNGEEELYKPVFRKCVRTFKIK